MSDYNSFGKDYFTRRLGNDPARQKSYESERDQIAKHMGRDIFNSGKLLDVGCSTGEFIDAIGWKKDMVWGMEISEYAKAIARDKGIKFELDLFTAESHFDLIVFRGTIQYIPKPFDYIENAYKALKPGGRILFLATPNTNSLYYRCFKTLPFLEENLNYWIPCDTSLKMILRNMGFSEIQVYYPYLKTPYCNFWMDHLRFSRKLVLRTNDRFAFWGSSMTVWGKK